MAKSKSQGPQDLNQVPRGPFKLHKFKVSKAEDRTFEGIVFDSKLEMSVYKELLKLFPREEIHMQPRFELQPGFRDTHGRAVRAIVYVADFLIGKPREGGDTAPLLPDQLLLDAKGMETPEYRLKLKMLSYRYKHTIVPIKSVKDLYEILLMNKLITQDQCPSKKSSTRSGKRSVLTAPSVSPATAASLEKSLTSLSGS